MKVESKKRERRLNNENGTFNFFLILFWVRKLLSKIYQTE